MFFYLLIIATLGSILDFQLSWKSGKFQLARWSHEVVIFSARTDRPTDRPTRPTSQSSFQTSILPSMSNNPNVHTCLDAKLCINISLYWPDYGNISWNQTSDYSIWSAHRNELLQIVRSSESGNNFHNRLSQKTIEYFTTTNFKALFWNQNFWNLKFLDLNIFGCKNF